MAYRPPVAVLDACVLYPFHTRNLLVQFAVDRLVDARWTDTIHDEWMRNLAADAPGIGMDRLRRTRDLMKAALPAADVRGYEPLIPGIVLPDPDDRHVVAAAIAGGASVVVTWNMADFPEAELARHGLQRETPDQFALRLYEGCSGGRAGCGRERPPQPPDQHADGGGVCIGPRAAGPAWLCRGDWERLRPCSNSCRRPGRRCRQKSSSPSNSVMLILRFLRCKRNIEASPLCQVEMAPSPAVLPWEAGCGGCDDEQARVRPA